MAAMARARAGRSGEALSRATRLARAIDEEVEDYRGARALVADLRWRQDLCVQPAAGSRSALQCKPRGRQDCMEAVLRRSLQDEPGCGQARRGAEIHAGFRRRQTI